MKAGKTPHSSIISNIASFIIRQRLTVIITIGILTIFMLWQAMGVRIAYDNQKLVPKDDADFIRYERFLNEFGEDGNKLIVGFTQKDLFTKDGLNRYIETTNKVKSIQGIQGIIGIPSAIDIIKDDSIGRFTIKSIVDGKVGSDKEAEEIRNTIVNRPFYKDLIYLENKDIAISAVVINKSYLDNIRRIELIDSVKMYYDAYAKESGVEMHYSGLPFVRHVYSTLVKNELKLFIILAAIVTALLLLLFFRAAPNIIIPLLMVVVSVIWSMGWMGLLDYKMSIISALIPPLMIVIGIPNCIYFINRYHEELKHTGKKFLALHRVMNKVGSATFLTNLTTAIGFGVFALTRTEMLRQFGLVTFLSIMCVFILTLTIVPIVFSYLPNPKVKHTKHLENKYVKWSVNAIHRTVFNHPRRIFFFTFVLIVFAAWGGIKLKSLVYMVDDIPKKQQVYQDLMFFQEHMTGVMPFEVIVDTHEPDGIKDPKTLNKLRLLQKKLGSREELSKGLSIVNAVSFANQAYNNGDKKYYRLPVQDLDYANIADYLGSQDSNSSAYFSSLVNEDFSKARLSFQMKDIGSIEMNKLLGEVAPNRQKKGQQSIITEIFPKSEYDTYVTGTSMIFLKGNDYLVSSLIQSMLLAFTLIAIIMGALFTSWKMVFISLVPNIIPMILTIGFMGHFGVPLKPSTILVFSIAFGIAVDDTIHFLAKFRYMLKQSSDSVVKVTSDCLKEMGQSMIYTSVVLFFGFIIFAFSNFQGTVALGLLTGLTLLVAMFSNLFVLPAMIIAFEKGLNPRKELSDAVIKIDMGEEEDDSKS
jgi:predicted RND superfamily exporter protein